MALLAASLPATMSAGERYLLANAGVQNADPAIRQEIAADRESTRAADESFTNSLLFGSTAPSGTAPVDADAEAHRIDAQKAGGTAASPAVVKMRYSIWCKAAKAGRLPIFESE